MIKSKQLKLDDDYKCLYLDIQDLSEAFICSEKIAKC